MPLPTPDVTRPAGHRTGGQQIVPRPPRWSPGPPAPWEIGAEPSLADVLAAVPEHDKPPLPSFPNARHSAVLVTLAEGGRGPEVLLTRRSWELRSHRGEISFPGGRTDPGESAAEAALREAHEEVGLDPAVVEVRGELEHLNTVVSRSYIVPKVATVDEPMPLEAQTMEVDRVLWVPLSEFLRPDTYRSEVWGIGSTDRVLHFFELDDETVWGATAHMLVDLFTRTFGP
ncbi:MAG: CoA pyrophosphatase [Ilumatobacter sp.]|nr:CoA pyrophosphatase [Ilumatobacter sp.]